MTESIEIIKLGSVDNGNWICIGYDILYRYGYQMMLYLFDQFTSMYDVKLDRVAKAKVAGMNHSVVWRRILLNKALPLSEMDKLKEECGEIAIGGIAKKLSNLQVYLTLTNQTSIIVFQIPKSQFSEDVNRQLYDAALFIQSLLKE